MRHYGIRFGLAGAMFLAIAGSAPAQTPDALDPVLLAGATADAAMALARQQADGGQLLEALATSERALFLDRKSKSARLFHAALLCRLDDPHGAAAEFSLLKMSDYKQPEWQAATAQCPAVSPPARR